MSDIMLNNLIMQQFLDSYNSAQETDKASIEASSEELLSSLILNESCA